MRTLVVILALFMLITSIGLAQETSEVSKADSLLTVSLPDTFQTKQPIYLYGERFNPPHIVQWIDRTLFCHEVQIAPRLREPVAPPSAASVERFALDCLADSAASATGAEPKSRPALEAMREVYAGSALVQRAWFDNDGRLWVKFWNDMLPVGVGIQLGQRQVEATIDPYADAIDLYRVLVNAFRFNRRVFIGSEYVSVIAHTDKADYQLQALKEGRVDESGPLTVETLQDIARKEGSR